MDMTGGEERAWEKIGTLRAEEVCRNAGVSCGGGLYVLRSLGMDFSFNPEKKEIRGISPDAESLLLRLRYFFGHSALWYLACAKDAGLTGRLLRPSNLKGGHHFFRGTHELPLEGLAEKYGKAGEGVEGFIKRALALGGRPLGHGDASAELSPFPRIPVTLILHRGDEEFPAAAELFFDSSCEVHLPLDILWSTAMLTALAMLL